MNGLHWEYATSSLIHDSSKRTPHGTPTTTWLRFSLTEAQIYVCTYMRNCTEKYLTEIKASSKDKEVPIYICS